MTTIDGLERRSPWHTIVIVVIAILQLIYSNAMKKRGVLR